MAPKKSQTLFPAGEQECRSARLRCAIACQTYNSQSETIKPEERVALWLDIVQPSNNSSRRQPAEPLSANQSQKRRLPLPNASTATTAQSAPTSALHFPTTDDTATTFRSIVSPTILDFEASSNRGSCPATQLQPPLDTISKSHPHATIASPKNSTSNSVIRPDSLLISASATNSEKGFPGQGRAPYIKAPLHIDYGTRLEIAPSTFINRNLKILDTPVRTVRIGERCLIGPDFHIYAVSHPLDYRERKGPADAPSYALDVTIEDDCWIGGRVTVLGGVTIGRGCVIGANSLVTKDIPAYHIAYGSPARIARRLSGPHADSPDNWSPLSEFSATIAGIANRPVRVREVVVAVCGIGVLWSFLKLLLGISPIS